ncbi:MAG: UDP-N-acetyl-D-mannosaminuronate dehydrogenase [Myxococcota bacterium]|jgi:UDP-N-acetyl-D-mannosaminuronate dehydrogenase
MVLSEPLVDPRGTPMLHRIDLTRHLDLALQFTGARPDRVKLVIWAIGELSSTEAEVLKVASDALFGVKVSFANKMAELAGRLDVSWEPVRRALVLDPRIGDGHLRVPGPVGLPGFGGSCLPKDMSALVALAPSATSALPVSR